MVIRRPQERRNGPCDIDKTGRGGIPFIVPPGKDRGRVLAFEPERRCRLWYRTSRSPDGHGGNGRVLSRRRAYHKFHIENVSLRGSIPGRYVDTSAASCATSRAA